MKETQDTLKNFLQENRNRFENNAEYAKGQIEKRLKIIRNRAGQLGAIATLLTSNTSERNPGAGVILGKIADEIAAELEEDTFVIEEQQEELFKILGNRAEGNAVDLREALCHVSRLNNQVKEAQEVAA